MHTYKFKMWYFDIWCHPTCSATWRIVFRCLKYNTRAHPFLLQTFIINWLTLDKLPTLLQLMGPSDFQLTIHWILIISKRICVVSSSPACTKFGKTKILRNYHWIPSFENIINPSSPMDAEFGHRYLACFTANFWNIQLYISKTTQYNINKYQNSESFLRLKKNPISFFPVRWPQLKISYKSE